MSKVIKSNTGNTQVKYPREEQDRPMDFNVTVYKNLPIWFQMPHCD